ncbi:hypothetical protein [Pseudophaeobacter sp. C1-32P7]|uniref:head-tail connector protein n=1 Tax=Pseudophaeobacter sp. C1-32P7 TaxID=3098142 RepID=UPI0034D4B9D8
MFRPTLKTPPAAPPVTLEEVKAHAVVEFDDDDVILTGLRDAAVAHLDGFRGILGRGIVSQVWEQAQACWRRAFVLPVPDVSAVTISYADTAGTSQVVDAAHVKILPVSVGTRIVLSDAFDLPALEDGNPAPITVEFTCGFGDAANVPADLKVAIAAYAACWNEARGEMPIGIAPVINKYRWTSV